MKPRRQDALLREAGVLGMSRAPDQERVDTSLGSDQTDQLSEVAPSVKTPRHPASTSRACGWAREQTVPGHTSLRTIHIACTLLGACKRDRLILGPIVQIVAGIDERELGGEPPWKSGVDPKVALPAANREYAMAPPVAGPGAVVKLGHARSRRVIGRGGEEK
jgi:hypothetical protein